MLTQSTFTATGPQLPRHSEPRTLGEQMQAVMLSLWRAEQNGTTAAQEWEAARQLVAEFTPAAQTDETTQTVCKHCGGQS